MAPSASCLVQMIVSPFLGRGNNPIPGIKLNCVTAVMEPRAKAPRQQNPNTFPCCFRLKVPYMHNCMAQGGSTLVTISAELLRRSKFRG